MMKFFRISSLLSLLCAILFGVLLFWTSQAVQTQENRLENAKAELAHETETVRVLAVEWDYLNRPQRLESLAHELLGMEAPTAKELLQDVSDIPEPSLEGQEGFNSEEVQTYSISLSASKDEQSSAHNNKKIIPQKAEKENFEALIQSLDQSSQEDLP
jgi:hypothetical protein